MIADRKSAIALLCLMTLAGCNGHRSEESMKEPSPWDQVMSYADSVQVKDTWDTAMLPTHSPPIIHQDMHDVTLYGGLMPISQTAAFISSFTTRRETSS